MDCKKGCSNTAVFGQEEKADGRKFGEREQEDIYISHGDELQNNFHIVASFLRHGNFYFFTGQQQLRHLSLVHLPSDALANVKAVLRFTKPAQSEYTETEIMQENDDSMPRHSTRADSTEGPGHTPAELNQQRKGPGGLTNSAL